MKEARFNLPDGRQLAWYEAGQGRPLIMLHGWSMSAAVFAEVVGLLADDFRLMIPDLPGHGNSSLPQHSDLAAITADLTIWISTLTSAPIALVGWSLGGMLAMEMCLHSQCDVARLVLVGTTPRFTLGNDWAYGLPSAQVQAMARSLQRRFEATLGDFFALAFAGEDISGERLRAIKSLAVKRSALPDPAAALELLETLASHDQRGILPHIQVPTLVLHGDSDQIVPVAAARYLSEMLPEARLAEFSGVGHAPFLSQPYETAALLRGFC